MEQVTSPNLTVKGSLGLCLLYVRDVFSAPWAGSDAWTSWMSYTKHKHTDALPKGVYIPIWFDGYWDGKRLGHVAVYKDGKVWSSPYKTGQNFAVLNSIAEVERIYGMKYVGWSEDIGGKIIVQKEDTMTPAALAALYQLGAIKHINGDDKFVKENTGKDPLKVITDLLHSAAHKEVVKRYHAGTSPDMKKVGKYNQIEKIVKG